LHDASSGLLPIMSFMFTIAKMAKRRDLQALFVQKEAKGAQERL
jgi:hypothetical protein